MITHHALSAGGEEVRIEERGQQLVIKIQIICAVNHHSLSSTARNYGEKRVREAAASARVGDGRSDKFEI